MCCKHKFGEIRAGYQYCVKCGKAIPIACNHTWKIYSASELIRGDKAVVGQSIVLQCSRCGEMKHQIFKVYE